MTDERPDAGSPDPEADARSEDERRRRRARVFGDVLPEGTRDDRADAWSERDPGPEGSEEWLRRQVPPHHGQ